MRILLTVLLLSHSFFANSQNFISKNNTLKWEASVSNGLYLDMFYANIVFGGDDGNPPGYPSKKGKRINPGFMNRYELKYFFSPKSAISFYYQNARYFNLIGNGNDPLEVWTDLRKLNRRWHFTLNYNRNIPSGKRGTWSFGSGFQVQIEKKSFPYYRVDDPNNPTVITEISARPDWTYFEDWAIPLTVTYHWSINKNLKLGLMLNTAYTTGTGVDGLSLMGNIAIPFGQPAKERKRK